MCLAGLIAMNWTSHCSVRLNLRINNPSRSIQHIWYETQPPVRFCVAPTSTTMANITLALNPMSKEELKSKAPGNYHNHYCPQVALDFGENIEGQKK